MVISRASRPLGRSPAKPLHPLHLLPLRTLSSHPKHPSFDLSDPSLLSSQGFIAGRPIPALSGKTYDLIDPGTAKPWHRMAAMGMEETDQAITAAHEAFPAFAGLPARVRGRMILEMDRLFVLAKRDLGMIAVMECGKSLGEAEGEVVAASAYSWLMAGEAERNTGETIRGADTSNSNMRYFTIREPLGPAALLSPWNFPILLPWRKLVSALAAGCTVIMKPSPETASTSVAMALIAQRAGVPDGVVNVVVGDEGATPGIGKVLCEDTRVKKLHFTGSTSVGKLLAKQCAGTLKKLTLELGGNGAFIVFEDADLEKAAEMLVANKFRNAGQVCVTANRVYVHSSIHDRFVHLISKHIQALRTGHGLDPGTTLGSLATRRGVERCEMLIADARRHGGEVLLGGKRQGAGWGFEPTLIVRTGFPAMIHQEEMFGPILSVYAFEGEEEVINLANASPMGLTNYIFTRDISRAWRCFEALKSGQVAINTANASSSEIPFGGIGNSGMGKEGGYGYGVEGFCRVRVGSLML